ncbi:MAG TPA: alpha/beta hydrolase [Allosphingosinicella sp.]|jgi:hypothetical protein
MPAFLSTKELARPERVHIPIDGMHIVGHLYRPPDYRPGQRYAALAIAGSLTSVKEQMGGIYASQMARRGIMGLAIDYRNFGESGGDARQYEDPASKSQDLSAAVAYLASRPDVEPGRVGLLGVCTTGANVIQAAARDPKVRAVAAVAGHYAEPSYAPTFYASMFDTGPEIVDRFRREGRSARALYERTGENMLVLAYSNTERTASHFGPMPYYMDPSRGGGVPQWRNAFAVMSWEPWLSFDPVADASRVGVPTLLVHSDGCVMPDQARKVFDLLGGRKSLHWADGDHFQFYDDPEKVGEAADTAAEHFRKYLA